MSKILLEELTENQAKQADLVDSRITLVGNLTNWRSNVTPERMNKVLEGNWKIHALLARFKA